MPSDLHAGLRAAMAAVAVVALMGALALVDAPVVEIRVATIAVLAVAWVLPVVVYWLAVRTAPLSLLVGLVLVAGQPLAASAVLGSDSSTTGLGWPAFGVLWWVVVGIGIGLSRASARAGSAGV